MTADIIDVPASSESKYDLILHCKKLTFLAAGHSAQDITKIREHYRCPHFRILIIGRANAGKTTILEKVCGVAKGTKPVVIYDKGGKLDVCPT